MKEVSLRGVRGLLHRRGYVTKRKASGGSQKRKEVRTFLGEGQEKKPNQSGRKARGKTTAQKTSFTRGSRREKEEK